MPLPQKILGAIVRPELGDMTLTDESSIDYGKRMHKALRGLVVELMNEVAERGLPGNHHFFVTFETAHPEADIPAWMVEKYPDEMTIVLQHSFEDLAVRADDFTVTLRFSDVPYTVTVPFDAIRTFVDPSVEFGLRFDSMISGEARRDLPRCVPQNLSSGRRHHQPAQSA